MRIVGGEFRGRRLATPRSDATRPTADRTREALFNILSHKVGVDLEGRRVLDLFAGTGALGLEALSRGAEFCLFVEQQPAARAVIRQNIETLGLQGRTRIFRRDAARLGEVGTMLPFGLVFCDPPYGNGLGERALRAALDGGWLTADALLVAEESAATPCEPGPDFSQRDERRFGDSVVRLFDRDSA